jgi:hypothetical protein
LEKTIEVKISYCDKDIKQAMFYIINHIYRLWVVVLCSILVVLGILFYGISKGFDDYLFGLTFVFAFITLLFDGFCYQRPINGYISFYRKRKGGKYIFSENDIKAIGEEIQSTFIWSVFKKAYDIPSALVFIDENRFMYIFPKRCFDNLADIEQLQQLMSSNIKSMKVYK